MAVACIGSSSSSSSTLGVGDSIDKEMLTSNGPDLCVKKPNPELATTLSLMLYCSDCDDRGRLSVPVLLETKKARTIRHCISVLNVLWSSDRSCKRSTTNKS